MTNNLASKLKRRVTFLNSIPHPTHVLNFTMACPPSTIPVFLEALNVRVDVATKLLSCVACKGLLCNLFISYECGHHTCATCTQDAKAHACSTPPLPAKIVPTPLLIVEALRNIRRYTRCGCEFFTLETYVAHIKVCSKCMNMSLMALVASLRIQRDVAVKKSETLESAYTELKRKCESKPVTTWRKLRRKINPVNITPVLQEDDQETLSESADDDKDSDYEDEK